MFSRALAGTRWATLGWTAVVLLGGVGASLAVWDPLEVDEQAHLRRMTAQTVRSIKADLEADVQARLLAQVRLAEMEGWEENPHLAFADLEWTLNCQLFLDHYPSYLHLEWFDGTGRPQWRLPRDGPPVRLAEAVEAPAARGAGPAPVPAATTFLSDGGGVKTHGVSVSPVYRLPNGRAATSVVAPVVRDHVLVGFLVGVSDIGTAVASMLSDHSSLGYSVSVRDGPHEIFRTPGADGPDSDAWVHEVALDLPGTQWQVRVWPDTTLLSEMRSSLPEFAGVLGGMLGSALLLTWRFGKSAQSRSRELSEARDQLERRVAQRTTELQQANEHLESQIKKCGLAEDSLRDLSGRLLRLQDEERRRIARELHDSTTQMLGALAITVGQAELVAQQKCRNSELSGLLHDATGLVQQVVSDIRTVSHLLHPPVLDELGLEYVLPWFLEGFSKRSGVAVELNVAPNLGRLPQQVEITLFRIAQEALTNVHRHSGSPTASISLFTDAGSATLMVEDRGCGIPQGTLEQTDKGIENLGVGIAGMRERVRQLGGRLELAGGRGGTTVKAVLPLPQDPSASRF